MFDALGGADLYATILLLKSNDKRAIAIVEGVSDYSALIEHVNEEDVNLQIGYGRASVEDAMALASDDDQKDVIALVDNDLGAFRGDLTEMGPVFRTDLHDLEAEIFSLPRIANRIIYYYADNEKLRAHLAELQVDSPAQIVSRISAQVGLLRYISKIHNLRIALSSFPFHEVLVRQAGHLDVQKFSRIAYARSEDPGCSESELRNTIGVISEIGEVTFSLCRGHDLALVAAACLRKWWGGRVSSETIEDSLRTSLACYELKKVPVFMRIKAWGDEAGHKFWNCDAAA